jgi:cytoskeletal protein CcmA (bactofilin family)
MKTITGTALRALLVGKSTLLDDLEEVTGDLDLRGLAFHSLIFGNIRFKGDIDFGNMEVDDIRITSCIIEGRIRGSITYTKEIYVRHPFVWYWDNYCEKTLASSQVAEFFAQEGY